MKFIERVQLAKELLHKQLLKKNILENKGYLIFFEESYQLFQ